MKNVIKKIVIIVLVVAIFGGGYYLKVRNSSNVQYTTAKVERGNLKQTVSETGVVRAAEELSLNFLNNGRISKINVKVGDKVVAGQIITELDYYQLSIKLREAQANLAKLYNGSTISDIAVAEAGVNQAKSGHDSALRDLEKTKKTINESIAQAKKNLADLESSASDNITIQEQAVLTAENNLSNTKKTYEQAYNNKIDGAPVLISDKIDAANISLDAIAKILNDDSIDNYLSIKNSLYLVALKTNYDDAKNLLLKARSSLSLAQSGKSIENINRSYDDTISLLKKTTEALSNAYQSLENSITAYNFTQTSLDAYKTSISVQQTITNTNISATQSSKQALADAKLAFDTNALAAQNSFDQAKASLANALLNAKNAYVTAQINGDQQIASAQSRVDSSLRSYEVARTQLDKIRAGSRREDIALAQAGVDAVKNQIENSVLRAPLNGVITKVNYEVGEDFAPAKAMINMLGEDKLEIESNVPESDIVKVRVGQKANITFDALTQEENFIGDVISIDPAATVIQDVITYKVRLRVEKIDEKIKPGMSANIDINTDEKVDTFFIPMRAIKDDGDKKYVEVLIGEGKGQKVDKKYVEVGLEGNEGMIEILKGLNEGEFVVTFIKK